MTDVSAEQDNRYDFRTIKSKWQKRWEDSHLFVTDDSDDRPRFYGLDMFPYPSGAGISVGHCRNYVPLDVACRFKLMQGYNVLHPMGWDAFGQPAENEAIKRGRNPREMVREYAANYKRQLKLVGISYDWSREINSSEPDYYRWNSMDLLAAVPARPGVPSKHPHQLVSFLQDWSGKRGGSQRSLLAMWVSGRKAPDAPVVF